MILIKKIYLAIITGIVAILLISHTFKIGNFNIDSITILLISILLVIPYLSRLTKLKIGEFEAEISANEVKKIEDKIHKIKPLSKDRAKTNSQKELDKIASEIEILAKNSPELGLLKLRIELERAATKLYLINHKSFDNKSIAISKKIQHILSNFDSEKEYLEISMEVISICNRVAHGEKIDNTISTRVLVLGLKMLGYFYGLYAGYSDGVNQLSKLK